jgi:hypothetical protein
MSPADAEALHHEAWGALGPPVDIRQTKRLAVNVVRGRFAPNDLRELAYELRELALNSRHRRRLRAIADRLAGRALLIELETDERRRQALCAEVRRLGAELVEVER